MRAVLLLLATCALLAPAFARCPTTEAEMRSQSNTNGINFSLGFVPAAIKEILAILTYNISTVPSNNGTRIDNHVHFVPDWYRALQPFTGGSPTPQWNVSSHLAFMAANGIGRSIVSISAPGANVCWNNSNSQCPRDPQVAAVTIARLLNYYAAALAFKFPTRFSFYGAVPLPYTTAAVAEAQYALDTLGAAAIGTLTNHQALYIGNANFTPLFKYLDSRPFNKEIVFVHPNTPCIRVGNNYYEANPTDIPTGIDEFFFEDARGFIDLTKSQTIQNFTKINYVVPHSGGSFMSVLDRFLSVNPALRPAAIQAITTRLWYDSAGPSYPRAAYALLGYGVNTSRLIFGTDYPYAPPATVPFAILGVVNTPWLTPQEKQALFTDNAKTLFSGKIQF